MAHNPLDRCDEGRKSPDWLNRQWCDSNAVAILTHQGNIAATATGLWQHALDALPQDLQQQAHFLGRLGEQPWFVLETTKPLPEPDDYLSLRALATSLDRESVSLAAHANALSHWHRHHQFCGACATETTVQLGGVQRVCPSCNHHIFPRLDPAVIMLILQGEKALIARAPNWPENQYSTLAGFVEPGEDLDQAVRREVMEEVGVEVSTVRYAGSQPWPLPSSLMIGFYGVAATTKLHHSSEIAHAIWVTRDELRAALDSGDMRIGSSFSISSLLVRFWLDNPSFNADTLQASN
jgi:NAD+ diphosphatase